MGIPLILRRIVDELYEFPIDDKVKVELLGRITKIIQSETEAEQKALSEISAVSDALREFNIHFNK